MNICRATFLSNELVGSAYRQAWSSNPRYRACRPNGKGMGYGGVLSDIVGPTGVSYTARSESRCFSRYLIQMCGDSPPATGHTSFCWPRQDLAAHADSAYRQPANMQLCTFCYH